MLFDHHGRGTKTEHHDPSLFSSFLHLHKEKLMELELHLGKQSLTILGLRKAKRFPQPEVTVWCKEGFEKGFIKYWWRSPRKRVEFPFLEI